MIIKTKKGNVLLDPKPHWHLVSKEGMSAMMFYNNVQLSEGLVTSVSIHTQSDPNLTNMGTPYSISRMNDPKEILYEKIRSEKYPNLPSRLKSLYVFDEKEVIDKVLCEWYPNESKAIHECMMQVGTVFHRADSNWLNSRDDEWEKCANEYWGGAMSIKPLPEVLVHSVLYFPGYKDFPKAIDFQNKNA